MTRALTARLLRGVNSHLQAVVVHKQKKRPEGRFILVCHKMAEGVSPSAINLSSMLTKKRPKLSK
jgi:hypothetical protein